MFNNSDDQTIHEHDFIFQFLAKLPTYQGEGKAVAAYLAGGRDSAMRLRGLIVEDLGRDDVSLLEFAAGYGCVTRYLREVLPRAEITACDIHDEAVRFIEDRFRVKAVSSISDPDKLSLGRKFDVVFALSFFSHMPKHSWTRWLRALARHTAAGGDHHLYHPWPAERSVFSRLPARQRWPLVQAGQRTGRPQRVRLRQYSHNIRLRLSAKFRMLRVSTWRVSTRASGGDTRIFTSLVARIMSPKINSSMDYDYPI